MNLTTHLHLVLRLRISTAIHPLPHNLSYSAEEQVYTYSECPVNPSAWSDERCSSYRKHHLSWSDEHCSSCCTLSLIRLYLDNIGRKCNRAAMYVFTKELALLWCGRQILQIISSFFSLLSKFGFYFCGP